MNFYPIYMLIDQHFFFWHKIHIHTFSDSCSIFNDQYISFMDFATTFFVGFLGDINFMF